MKGVWLVCFLALAGCAGTIGVQQTGPDSYLVSEMRAPILGGGQAAQRDAIGEAVAFCRERGHVFVPVMMGPAGYVNSSYGPSAYTASFRCLAPGDPIAARLASEHAPWADSTPPAKP